MPSGLGAGNAPPDPAQPFCHHSITPQPPQPAQRPQRRPRHSETGVSWWEKGVLPRDGGLRTGRACQGCPAGGRGCLGWGVALPWAVVLPCDVFLPPRRAAAPAPIPSPPPCPPISRPPPCPMSPCLAPGGPCGTCPRWGRSSPGPRPEPLPLELRTERCWSGTWLGS